jgi:uncharacterized protein (DUF4415 family)
MAEPAAGGPCPAFPRFRSGRLQAGRILIFPRRGTACRARPSLAALGVGAFASFGSFNMRTRSLFSFSCQPRTRVSGFVLANPELKPVRGGWPSGHPKEAPQKIKWALALGLTLSNPGDARRITIRLDDDILDWFRQQVDRAGDGNYQSLINDALRQHNRRAHEATLRRVVREELTHIDKS